MNDEKTFDAGRSYLCEPDREPSAKWRTVSLVTAVFRLVERGPDALQAGTQARRVTITAAADELTARGIDAVALIRYGMSQQVIAPVISGLLLKLILGDDLAIEGVNAPAWCAALGIGHTSPLTREPASREVVSRFGDVIVPALRRVRHWVDSASLDEIIELSPPGPGELAAAAVTDAADQLLRDQYRWIVDRFAQTFYRDWATSSLHNELRWLDGRVAAPCNEGLMADRAVPRQELLEEIARRTVYGTGTPDVGDSITAEMTRHAITLLHHGRYRDAVAVFEFGITQRPDDAEIRNNLGFCLIPIDPSAALDHLKAASDMGYAPSATNSYNQMCCYWALGRSRAALNIANAEGTEPCATDDTLLWRPTARGDWELHNVDDPARSIAIFAAEISRLEGWQDQEERWQAILNMRSNAITGEM